MRTKSIKYSVLSIKYKRGFAMFWILILVVAVVLGLVAIFAAKNLNIGKNATPISQTQNQDQDAQVKALSAQSDSDEPDAIEQDVNATKLDDVDQGLESVEADLSGMQ